MRTLALAASFATLLSSSSQVHAGEDLQGLKVGYQDGFYARTMDDQFGIKVGSRFNFGYTYGFVGPSPDFSSFDLLHAKLYAGGNAFGSQIQMYVQAGGATSDRGFSYAPAPESANGSFVLEDYYVRFNNPVGYLKLGQFKVPFSRQWMIYSGNLQFVDRSIVTRAFALGRDRGIVAGGDRETFAYSLGVFNGGGFLSTTQGVMNSGTQYSNNISGGAGHLYVARFVAMPAGSGGYSEGDVETREGNRTDFGVGVTFDQGRHVDTGGTLAVEDTDVDILSTAAEFTWKSEGSALQGEFFYRKFYGSTSADFDALGFYIQPSYFFIPRKFETALRFGWLDPSRSAGDDRIFEGSAALNLYLFSDHRYKTQLQYTWRGQELPAASRNDDSFIDLVFQVTI